MSGRIGSTQSLQRLVAVAGLVHLVADRLEQSAKQPPVQVRVVDDEDPARGAHASATAGIAARVDVATSDSRNASGAMGLEM